MKDAYWEVPPLKPPPAPSPLTPREEYVLQQIDAGRHLWDLAREFDVQPERIRQLIRRARRKLGAP